MRKKSRSVLKILGLGAVVLTLAFSFPALSAEVSGYIQRDTGNRVASDLASPSGDPYPALQLIQMKSRGYDLSKLNPVESDIWSAKGGTIPSFTRFKAPKDELSFAETLPSAIGEFWFSAYLPSDPSTRYEFMVGRKAHNMLLRAALLLKLGYAVPQIEHLPIARIRFETELDKEDFLQKMKDGTATSQIDNRWIVASGGTTVVLQDALVMRGNLDFYNLGLGYFPASGIQGRRSLNALTVPYALVDVPESINLLNWYCGKNIGAVIALQHSNADQFSPTFDDAKWIVRKLSTLTRADFQDIVNKAALPDGAAQLLTEKLISRRNSLVALFGLRAPKLAVHYHITEGTVLKNGKLIPPGAGPAGATDFWPGYGSRFAFGDFEDPFSFSEVSAYVESALMSSAIGNLVTAFNQYVLPNTNINGQIADKREKILENRLNEFLTTGKVNESSFGTIKVPFFNMQLIASRDLIMGKYLGTDNSLQVAESIGMSVDAGLVLDTDLLPSPWDVRFGAGASLSRTYTHLTPATGIRASLSQPFKNFLVPLFKYQLGVHARKEADTIPDSGSDLPKDLLKAFDDNFGVGESLIVTDSISANANQALSAGITSQVSASASAFEGALVISRTHIYRASQNRIQIYRETGDLGTVSFGFSINAVAPVLTLNFPMGLGHASTRLYNLDFGKDVPPETLKKNLLALERVLKYNSTDYLDVVSPPYQFEHHFTERGLDLSLFFFKYQNRSIYHSFKVTDPEGHKKDFVDRIYGVRHGKDFEDLGVSAVNAAIQALTPVSFQPQLSMPAPDDPGNSLWGSSHTRTLEYQGEKSSAYSLDGSNYGDFIVKVTYKWKGFGADRGDLEDILRQIRQKAGNDIYPTNVLNNTKKVRFYDISLYMQISADAVQSVMGYPEDKLRLALLKDLERRGRVYYQPETNQYIVAGSDSGGEGSSGETPADVSDKVAEFYKYKRNFLAARAKGDLSTSSKAAINAVDFIENLVGIKGIYDYLGGRGIAVSSSIGGLRYGDENGNEGSLTSNLWGQTPWKFPSSPWRNLMEASGVSESDLMLTWLIRGF